MSMIIVAFAAAVVFVAICYSTSCSLQSGNNRKLPKEITDELDPYN